MIEIGQVLSLKIRFNNSGVVANQAHPVLVVNVDKEKNILEIAHIDSITEEKKWKTLLKGNVTIKKDNPPETVIDKDSFVQKTIDDGNKETKRALALNAQMQAAYDSYNQAWENRQTSYDISSQKYSDATLGYERVYNPETGDIYKAYNGFTDDFPDSNFEPITDDMYTSPITGYIEK